MDSRGARATSAGPETPATGACPVVGESIGSRSESPWLPRPARPDGVTRTEQADPPTITFHPLLTAADVARVLNVGQRTVWRLASRAAGGSGPFPRPVRIGGKIIRWRWQDVEKYLAQLAGK